jgi:hypothetical protein
MNIRDNRTADEFDLFWVRKIELIDFPITAVVLAVSQLG